MVLARTTKGMGLKRRYLSSCWLLFWGWGWGDRGRRAPMGGRRGWGDVGAEQGSARRIVVTADRTGDMILQVGSSILR